jgi:hypothetical protein
MAKTWISSVAHELYQGGLTFPALGELYGISGGTARQRLLKDIPGLQSRPRGRKNSTPINWKDPSAIASYSGKIKLVEAIASLREGATYQEIADTYGVTRQNVEQTLLRYAPDLVENRRKAWKMNVQLDEQAARVQSAEYKAKVSESRAILDLGVALYLQGNTFDQCVKLTGIGRSNLSNRLWEERHADPMFPSERGRGGRPYNWAQLTLDVLRRNPTRQGAANELNLSYNGLQIRLKLLKAKGLYHG